MNLELSKLTADVDCWQTLSMALRSVSSDHDGITVVRLPISRSKRRFCQPIDGAPRSFRARSIVTP